MISYAAIWNTKKTEIIGYAKIDNYVGRRIPPKPNLDQLDNDADRDAIFRDKWED